MLTCKEVSHLVSESLDHRLPLRQRMGVRLHLMMCGMCRAYRDQILLLRRILHLYSKADDVENTPDENLSDEARQRIKDALKKNA